MKWTISRSKCIYIVSSWFFCRDFCCLLSVHCYYTLYFVSLLYESIIYSHTCILFNKLCLRTALFESKILTLYLPYTQYVRLKKPHKNVYEHLKKAKIKYLFRYYYLICTVLYHKSLCICINILYLFKPCNGKVLNKYKWLKKNITVKPINWNRMFTSILFQLKRLYQFSARESTIT